MYYKTHANEHTIKGVDSLNTLCQYRSSFRLAPSVVMEDDRQLQTRFQWQPFFNVCPDRHHEFSVRQLRPGIPHLLTESVSRMLRVCITDL